MQNNTFDGIIYFIGHIWLIFSPIYFVETCDLAMFFTELMRLTFTTMQHIYSYMNLLIFFN